MYFLYCYVRYLFFFIVVLFIFEIVNKYELLWVFVLKRILIVYSRKGYFSNNRCKELMEMKMKIFYKL